MQAKLDAELNLHTRSKIDYTVIRPGNLTTEPAGGAVMGRTHMTHTSWVDCFLFNPSGVVILFTHPLSHFSSRTHLAPPNPRLSSRPSKLDNKNQIKRVPLTSPPSDENWLPKLPSPLPPLLPPSGSPSTSWTETRKLKTSWKRLWRRSLTLGLVEIDSLSAFSCWLSRMDIRLSLAENRWKMQVEGNLEDEE